MSEKEGTAWGYLYNCMYLTSSWYGEIAYLESPIFEIFDELDSTIIGGLNERTLSFFQEKGWIGDTLRKELIRFKQHINSIDAQYWNPDDFDNLEDWKLARDWAKALMGKLKMKKGGWNSEGQVVIYTKE